MPSSNPTNLSEIMLINVIENFSPSSMENVSKSKVYELANKMSGYFSLKQPWLKSSLSALAYLKGEYGNDSGWYVRGGLLLDSKQRLLHKAEIDFLTPKDLLKLVVQHGASSIISFDVRFEEKRIIEREFSKYIRNVVESIDVKFFDHLELDFHGFQFDSHAELNIL